MQFNIIILQCMQTNKHNYLETLDTSLSLTENLNSPFLLLFLSLAFLT